MKKGPPGAALPAGCGGRTRTSIPGSRVRCVAPYTTPQGRSSFYTGPASPVKRGFPVLTGWRAWEFGVLQETGISGNQREAIHESRRCQKLIHGVVMGQGNRCGSEWPLQRSAMTPGPNRQRKMCVSSRSFIPAGSPMWSHLLRAERCRPQCGRSSGRRPAMRRAFPVAGAEFAQWAPHGKSRSQDCPSCEPVPGYGELPRVI